jgi:hypothetical protein
MGDHHDSMLQDLPLWDVREYERLSGKLAEPLRVKSVTETHYKLYVESGTSRRNRPKTPGRLFWSVPRLAYTIGRPSSLSQRKAMSGLAALSMKGPVYGRCRAGVAVGNRTLRAAG